MSGPINLLLVEDDAVDVMNVRRAFERAGVRHTLAVAHDGRHALEMLRGGQVAGPRRLVLLDINLPRMDGIELLRELRADPALAATVVVVLSTSLDERDRQAAFELHVAGYLVKPPDFNDFVALVTAFARYWELAELP